jgi:hypothetical protein
MVLLSSALKKCWFVHNKLQRSNVCFFRVGNAGVNLARSTPHGDSGLGPILSPPPGPHTFQPGHSLQPGIGGYGSSTDSVASPGTDNTDVSEKEGFCQVGG